MYRDSSWCTGVKLLKWGQHEVHILKEQNKWLNRALKAAIRKGSFNLEMTQALSNCLSLSKCGITKGYLLQSNRAPQLAQRPLKNLNSYKVLLSIEAVKFGQIPKTACKAFMKKLIQPSPQLFFEMNYFLFLFKERRYTWSFWKLLWKCILSVRGNKSYSRWYGMNVGSPWVYQESFPTVSSFEMPCKHTLVTLEWVYLSRIICDISLLFV